MVRRIQLEERSALDWRFSDRLGDVEPYVRTDGTRIWSLMQLERQLRPEVYGRRRGGYIDRRRIPAADG
jgi:hypothetical protein